MSDDAMQRLAALGLTLPTPPAPMGAYCAVVEAGSMLHVSMQGPLRDGRPTHRGLVGAELTVEEGEEAARCDFSWKEDPV
ncbi:MAG: RidA family protein [Rhizobiaceae bacterium]